MSFFNATLTYDAEMGKKVAYTHTKIEPYLLRMWNKMITINSIQIPADLSQNKLVDLIHI